MFLQSSAKPRGQEAASEPQRYRRVVRIGTGGMAEVFLAMMTGANGLKQPVVLKRLWPELAREQSFVDMLLEEARLSMRLRHPNIVRVHEFGWEDGGYYVAMEHIDGQPLRGLLDRVARDHLLPLPLALKVVFDALGALEYAHDLTGLDGAPLSIVHRDVSPQNVLITYDGTVKLIDFGVAKTVESHHATAPGVLKGRVRYMAPEQVRHQADRRADLFSVGVMLWELASGRRMWAGVNEAALTERLLRGERAPELPLGAGNNRDLARVCSRALAMDPRDRYTTAAEFRADLRPLMIGSDAAHTRELGDLLANAFVDSRAFIQAMIQDNLVTRERTDHSVPPPFPPKKERAPSADIPPVSPELVRGRRRAQLTAVALDGDDRLDNDKTNVIRRYERRRVVVWRMVACAALLLGAGVGAIRRPTSGRAPRSSVAIRAAAVVPPTIVSTTPPAAIARPAMATPASPPTPSTANRAPRPAAAPAEGPPAAPLDNKDFHDAIARGQQALANGELRAADAILLWAVQFGPDNAEAQGTLAEVRFERAMYLQARALAEKAAHLDPRNARYHTLVGDACFKLGLINEATAAYARARALRPNDRAITARLERVVEPEEVRAKGGDQ